MMRTKLDEMTFEMYVDCNMDAAITARNMGCHRTTVRKRVARHSRRLSQQDMRNRWHSEALAEDALRAAVA